MSVFGAMAKGFFAATLAVAVAFGVSAAEQGQSQTGKPAAKKFIYLEGGADTRKARAPLPPLFIESSSSSLEESLAQMKPSSLFLVEVDALGLSSPGIRPVSHESGAQQRAGFQIGYPLSAAGHEALRNSGVWLTTEVVLQAPGFAGRLQSLSLMPDIGRQSYNVGLNVAYAGFSLGAALSREQNGFDLGLQGVDLGLGYYGRSWFTNIQVGSYWGDRNPLAVGLMGDRSMQVYEFGAGYKLWPGLTFSGQFKYFDYSNPLSSGLNSADQEHVFSLDTKLNF